MEREEALRELTSEDSKQRFVAANALEMAGQSEDIASLLRARILETDAMVLSSIERAILKCGERDATPAQEIERGDPASYRAAVEWVSGVLVHEIGGKVGLVDYCASLEIGDYEKSRTKESMTALSSTLSAVEQLQLASKAAAQEQFDLAELVQETIDVESFDSSVEIFSIGSKPFFVFGVRRLLQTCNSKRGQECCRGLESSGRFGESPPNRRGADGSLQGCSQLGTNGSGLEAVGC